MDAQLTPDEEKLVEHAKEAITKYNKIRHEKGDIDTLYSFLLTEDGNIYDGACFDQRLSHANICAERVAIANMATNESRKAKIKSIVVADVVPAVEECGTPPCGTCRHMIWTFGSPETSVILMQYIQQEDGWVFPKIEIRNIKDFYPFPYEPNEHRWDGYVPPYKVK